MSWSEEIFDSERALRSKAASFMPQWSWLLQLHTTGCLLQYHNNNAAQLRKFVGACGSLDTWWSSITGILELAQISSGSIATDVTLY